MQVVALKLNKHKKNNNKKWILPFFLEKYKSSLFPDRGENSTKKQSLTFSPVSLEANLKLFRA